MKRSLSELIQETGFGVVVSLPKNNLELAKAAFECGVDAIKVHANVEHKASGTRFGSWSEEKPVIDAILKLATGPVGIMPGAAETLSPAELDDAADLGIEFLDIYDQDMPAWMLKSEIDKMIAIGHGYSPDTFKGLLQTGFATMIEASIIPSTSYGEPLKASDIAQYAAIVAMSTVPVVVPSQKRLVPSDLAILREIGVKGVILGTISIGSTPESFRENLPEFMKWAK